VRRASAEAVLQPGHGKVKEADGRHSCGRAAEFARSGAGLVRAETQRTRRGRCERRPHVHPRRRVPRSASVLGPRLRGDTGKGCESCGCAGSVGNVAEVERPYWVRAETQRRREAMAQPGGRFLARPFANVIASPAQPGEAIQCGGRADLDCLVPTVLAMTVRVRDGRTRRLVRAGPYSSLRASFGHDEARGRTQAGDRVRERFTMRTSALPRPGGARTDRL
jgi:hypothetical protein